MGAGLLNIHKNNVSTLLATLLERARVFAFSACLNVTDSGVDSFVFFLRDETFPLRGNELSGVAHT